MKTGTLADFIWIRTDTILGMWGWLLNRFFVLGILIWFTHRWAQGELSWGWFALAAGVALFVTFTDYSCIHPVDAGD